MLFSKTFGYAIRSILYLSVREESRSCQLIEIAECLKVPKHFLAKVMKKLAREGVIGSRKGPGGGFFCMKETKDTPLLKIATISGESSHFDTCILRLKKCNSNKPCPLHHEALHIKTQWFDLLCNTHIRDLLSEKHPEIIESISIA